MGSVRVENVSVGVMNTSDILRHCECGICDHNNESDCIDQECACCYNFTFVPEQTSIMVKKSKN